ncbi:putative membrane protein [Colletotrichum sidae]|uniref:Putative membrane protein n=1 Tax=Colletotrichum sidae TaxID=1347389 RepID=A0A4R8TP87_9PEZI|nr:putative membrane protein [Colletotrichum sidae]
MATQALRVALKQLGFQDTYHMLSASTENPLDCLLWSEALAAKYDGTGERFGRAKWDALLGHCQAVCDWPAASFADELIEAYPDAKVVLTTRDVDSWYKSTKATVNWRAQHDYMLWALSYVDWVRIVDFYQIASFQTCIALHLRYLRPELSPAELAHHVGLAQGMFTTAQIASAPLWGSAADRIGRKAVILIGLVGTALSCIGVAFAGSVSSIILWRLFAGAVNGTVMAARAAVSDNLALEHRPAGFSLLVLSFQVANVLGPVVTAMSMGSGASQRPVSPSESVQLGTSSWITNNPFAAPNILSAILLVGDAALVWLKLQEVHQKDYGKWQSWLFGRSNSHYRKLPDVNSGNTSSMRLEAIEEGQRHTTERSDSIWTPKFIVVLSTVCILEFHLGAFGSLWPLFVVGARRNADDPVQMPFLFTGGLQLKDADLGWAVGALGAIGVLLQLTAVPHVTVKYGAVRAFKASLPLFPLSLFLAPYLALVPAGHAWILRTTQLEERLNRLVNSLRVSGNTNAIATIEEHQAAGVARRAAASSHQSTSQSPGGPGFPTQAHPAPWDASSHIDSGPINIPTTFNSFVPPNCICCTEPGAVAGPPDTDENLLAIYRNELTPSLPFVVVPDTIAASTLAAARPFLMASIRMVASFRHPRSMRGQMYRLLSHVADHMLIRCERSLDMLLGLVVMLGWFHHHCIAHAQLNKLISLAATLAGELGLKRSPSMPERQRLLVMRSFEPRERTNEERRLLLAVWYLNSSTSLDLQHIDPMRFSVYVQQCLRELEQNRELESDMHVVYIVKIQRLAERISQIRGNEDGEEEIGLPKAPLSAYASSFQAELDKLQSNMPPSLTDNHFLKVRLATARLRLYEPPTIDPDLLASLSKSLTSLSSGYSSALDVFYQANAALKGWFEVWLAIPVQALYTMPLTLASHMIFAVVMMSRWAWLAASSGPATFGDRSAEMLDPSSNNPNLAIAAMEAAINPIAGTTPVSSSTPGSHPKGTPSATAAAAAAWEPPAPDRNLPQVLAELRAQLSRQPELMLDVAGILNRVANQLEEVDAAMAAVSLDSGPARASIWTLGATKVRIAQLRQKKWSDMVEQREDGDDDESQEEPGGLGEIDMQEAMAMNFSMGGWEYEGAWGPNLYDIVDPSMFIDGMGTSGDWAAGGLMNMASMDPLQGPQGNVSRHGWL